MRASRLLYYCGGACEPSLPPHPCYTMSTKQRPKYADRTRHAETKVTEDVDSSSSVSRMYCIEASRQWLYEVLHYRASGWTLFHARPVAQLRPDTSTQSTVHSAQTIGVAIIRNCCFHSVLDGAGLQVTIGNGSIWLCICLCNSGFHSPSANNGGSSMLMLRSILKYLTSHSSSISSP